MQDCEIAVVQHGRVSSQASIVSRDDLVLGAQLLVLALEGVRVSNESRHRVDVGAGSWKLDLGRGGETEATRAEGADRAASGIEVVSVKLSLHQTDVVGVDVAAASHEAENTARQTTGAGDTTMSRRSQRRGAGSATTHPPGECACVAAGRMWCSTPQKKWAHRAPEEEGAERGADGRE
ncbi:hypothetical protein PR002_g24696 [Phytophthora rubi]|uniref:Uncharacterized protein n=1 Tax=Phytophthora rubi TaxID=129364 RepID=A0A6A3IEJ7_9STRA|nr:hypothetical protein PR002_g24696 [Phytophthora rubi]